MAEEVRHFATPMLSFLPLRCRGSVGLAAEWRRRHGGLDWTAFVAGKLAQDEHVLAEVARSPAKPRMSCNPALKLQQDPLAQPSEQIVKRNEFNGLQSLRCPCRDRWIVVFSSYSVVDVGTVISMPGDAVLEWTCRMQKFRHSRHNPRVSK